MKSISHCWRAAFSAIFCFLSYNAFAVDDIVIVSAHPTDPSKPHITHEGAPITLKAAIRNASGSSYRIEWDTDLDGDFSDESSFSRSRNESMNGVWDIGQIWTAPIVDGNTRFDVGLRVTNLSTGAVQTSSFPVYVADFTPSNDPRNWTAPQRTVLAESALQEALWFIHRGLSLSGPSSSPTATASRNPEFYLLLFFLSAGHLPAWQPGTIDDFGLTLPPGWETANEERWNGGIYAETTMRLLNRCLLELRTQSIPGSDESNQGGYAPNGSVITVNRIPGTANGQGILASNILGTYAEIGQCGANGILAASLARCLDALGGVPCQSTNGVVRGKTFEVIVQEMVDWLGYAQIDNSTPRGSWYLTPTTSTSSGSACSHSTSWAIYGLQQAELFGGPYGVFVTNLHKYRSMDYLIRSNRGDGGVNVRLNHSGSGRYDVGFTAGILGALRWLGAHNFPRGNGQLPFPNETSYNKDQIRQRYDQAISFLAANWNRAEMRNSVSWFSGQWRYGDPLFGNTNAVYQARPYYEGSTLSLPLCTNAFKSGVPTLGMIGGDDWQRDFDLSVVRTQSRDANQSYSIFGRLLQSTPAHAYGTAYHAPYWSTAMGAHSILREHFAAGRVSSSVPEVNQTITLDASDSWGRTSSAIIPVRWDFDASDGLWWETAGTPDAEGNSDETFQVSYPTPGPRTITLQVLGVGGETQTLPVNVIEIPRIEVELTGIGVPLQNGVSSLSFQDLFDGEPPGSHTLSLTIRNVGTGTLTLLSPSLGGANPGEFSAGDPSDMALAPTEETPLVVTFGPTGTGQFSAALEIGSNDPDDDPFTISLDAANLTRTTLLSWANAFGITDVDPLSDDDFDNLTLLEEYAYNLNPGLPDGSFIFDPEGADNFGAPLIALVGTGTDARLRAQFVQRRTDPDLVYTVKFGSDVSEGHPDGLVPAAEAPNSEIIDLNFRKITINDAVTSASYPSRFGTVTVEYLPPVPE